MAITKNPYGVGASGQEQEFRTSDCTCCGLPFQWSAALKDPTTRTICGHCDHHAPDGEETLEHEASRRREDASRLLDLALRANERARRSGRLLTEAQEEVRDARRGTARAHETRREIERIAIAMAAEHIEERSGNCRCGQRHPCPTITAGRRVDPHRMHDITRAAERAGLDPT